MTFDADRRPLGRVRDIFYAGPQRCPAAIRELALDDLDDSYQYGVSCESFRQPAFG